MRDELEGYRFDGAEQLITPCLLIFPHIVRANIAEAIRLAGSPDRLRPHVKTHKSPHVVQLMQAAGISKFKCATLSEARMLGTCTAADVLVAYPQVGPAVAELVRIVGDYPQTRFSTVVDDLHVLRQLDAAFVAAGQRIEVLLDIDTGMHRTGVPVGEAAHNLYVELCRAQALTAGGLHIYDGQNHQGEIAARRAAVSLHWQPIGRMVSELKAQGMPLPRLVCGGTPTFPVYAQLEAHDEQTQIECAPGTCVLSDFNYGRLYADMDGFQPAAILMTRVISRQHADHVTVDLGYKAVASDPPAGRRCHFLNLPGAREIQHSEEHLVLETTHANRLQVGDVLFALPAHVCPTVALHQQMIVVEQGKVVDRWPVTARDRIV